MTSGPLRLGVVGCGRAARALHLPALQRVDGIDVVALADTDEDALGAAGEKVPEAARYVDYRRLLDDAAVEAVAVCVPAEMHEPVATAAMAAGKHVLIEKPLALDIEACDRLVAAAAAAPGHVLVGYNLRHHRLIQEMAARLGAGAVGEVEAVRSTWTSAVRSFREIPAWRDRRATGGGALFEIATHHIDLWRFLLGTEVETVYATGRSADTEDETVALTATLANGVLVEALFSERTAQENTLAVYGRKGRIAVDPFQFDGLTVEGVGRRGMVASRLDRLTAFAKSLPAGLASARLGGEFARSYDREWAHVRDVVRGLAEPLVTVEDGRRAVQVALAAAESLETGQPVRVPAPSATPRRGMV